MISTDVKRKLSYTQKPTIEFVESVPDVKVDIELLYQEFLPFETYLFDQIEGNVLIQKKYALMQKGVYSDIVDKMPYTKEITELVSSFVFYNAIYYRYVMPYTCYRLHTDTGKMCLHIPIITNEGCKFIYTDRLFTMPADGSLYLVNNSKLHTFANSGNDPRLHITFEIL